MNHWAAFSAILFCLFIALVLFLNHLHFHINEQKRIERFRSTPTYHRLFCAIRSIEKHAIDELRIESSGVTVTSVFPDRVLLNFHFKKNGEYCRNPDIARIAAQLLEEDFAILKNQDYYHLRRYCIYRPNGRKEYGYSYTMQNACKREVLEYAMARPKRYVL